MTRFASAVALTAALAACSSACSSARAPHVPEPTTEEWRRGLDRLAALRRLVVSPRTQRIAVEIREPRTGRILAARGAVAVAPPRALRMILLGPGGTTALDLWMEGAAFRFAVPAIDLKERGHLDAPRQERRGLPVDFLGWWLLRPLGGELLWHRRGATGDHFVLRDGAAVSELRVADDGSVEARRSTWSGSGRESLDEETLHAAGFGCAETRYHQRSTGVDVVVRCEDETLGAPAARALADPDAEGS